MALTALQHYEMCMQQLGDTPYAESSCLEAARTVDPNFNMTAANGGGGFWQDPNNVVALLGSAGAATGEWLNAFGIQPGGNQNQYVPSMPPEEKGMPAWAWVLIILALLVLLFVIIFILRK